MAETTPDPDAPENDTPDPPEPTPETEPNAELGDAGKKALEAERLARRNAERDAKAARTELEQLRTAQLTDHEQALLKARSEGEQAAFERSTTRLFSAEVRAVASGKLATPDLLSDPEVAKRLLGFSEFPTTESGDIDSEAISDAFDAFLEKNASLKASATRATGSADQGTRGTTPADLGELSMDEYRKARRASTN